MATTEMNRWLDQVLSLVKNSDPKDGELVISDPMICQSAAGFYIGTCCIEYSSDIDEWVPMPFERLSKYCKSYQMAELWYEYFTNIGE